MPRTTRAALRSKALAEEEAIAAAVPLPTTPRRERVPLGEIVDNQATEPKMTIAVDLKPVKQGGSKGRKAKGAKKGSGSDEQSNAENTNVEILEDDNRNSTSSAADEARGMLTNTTQDPQIVTVDSLTATTHAPDNNSTQSHPSQNREDKTEVRHGKTLEGAQMETHAVRTPHIESQMSASSDAQGVEAGMNIAPMSPKDANVPGERTEHSRSGVNTNEDSFVEQIKSRSPAKRISRIEDSVEALDQLEEEIEKAGQAITPPLVDEALATPAATTSNPKPAQDPNKIKGGPVTGVPPKANGITKPLKRSSVHNKINPKPNRASLLRQGIKPSPPSRVTKSPGNVAKQTQGSATARGDLPKSGTAVTKTNAVPARRVSSITKSPFQPAKSSKAPTQSAFELPGEAYSRKLKAQREERAKREEEENLKKKTFKARPVRLSQAPEVRMTTATKARLSMAREPSKDTVQHPNKRPSPLTASVSSLNAKKRTSSLSVIKTSNSPSNNNTNKRSSLSSVSGEVRTAPTAGDLANQKVKGKEAFARPRNVIAAREQERKEKEDAAKKARIDAAERGRIASREWAEKQKAKKMAETAAKPAITA